MCFLYVNAVAHAPSKVSESRKSSRAIVFVPFYISMSAISFHISFNHSIQFICVDFLFGGRTVEIDKFVLSQKYGLIFMNLNLLLDGHEIRKF